MRPGKLYLAALTLVFTTFAAADDRGVSPRNLRSAGPFKAVAQPKSTSKTAATAIDWLDNYGDAMKQAELGRKMLMVYFYDAQPSAYQQRFEAESLTYGDVPAKLAKDFVAVRLPLDYVVSIGGEKSKLLDHDAFAELKHRAGLAIIDFAHPSEDYYGYIVSLLPLTNGKYYRFAPSHLQTALELPSGTLTQRTMIFAVRIHPEQPRSTIGQPDRHLFEEAREHSRHQARIRLQGHHNWGQRFQRIAQLLGGGLRPKEVVAESWPGEGLVDAAVDCVDSWRQSSGHWGAVRATQVRYGYDIKKGENGIWYATGLFGDHRN